MRWMTNILLLALVVTQYGIHAAPSDRAPVTMKPTASPHTPADNEKTHQTNSVHTKNAHAEASNSANAASTAEFTRQQHQHPTAGHATSQLPFQPAPYFVMYPVMVNPEMFLRLPHLNPSPVEPTQEESLQNIEEQLDRLTSRFMVNSTVVANRLEAIRQWIQRLSDRITNRLGRYTTTTESGRLVDPMLGETGHVNGYSATNTPSPAIRRNSYLDDMQKNYFNNPYLSFFNGQRVNSNGQYFRPYRVWNDYDK